MIVSIMETLCFSSGKELFLLGKQVVSITGTNVKHYRKGS